MKKAKPWCRFRHRIYWKIGGMIVFFMIRKKYRPKLEKFKDAGKRQYLILMNHQTPYDQFFVGESFLSGPPVYFIATEDIFSLGFISRVLEHTLAPIPIIKVKNDLNCIKTCLKVVKEGGSICLAPEGNTTYSGYTGYMKPGIITMARKFGLPVVIYKIEGGYGKHPRWADDVRKGPMRAGVSRVIEPEEYRSLSNEEFLDLIHRELYVNECRKDEIYTSDHLAEYLERAMYVCPDCGLSVFESSGDRCTCKKCGKTIQYLPDKTIKGVGFDFPYRYVSEWYDYQCSFVNRLDPSDFYDQPAYTDTADLFTIDPCVSQKLLKEGVEIALFGNRMEIRTKDNDFKETFCFDDFDGAAVMGRNKLEICVKGKLWQFRGDKRFNALKYLNFYHRYKNVLKGDENVKFLGL